MRAATRITLALWGTLVGHGLAYWVGSHGGGFHPNTAAHAYLDGLVGLLTPLGVVALVRLTRVSKPGPTDIASLATLQAGLYVLQESLERGSLGLFPLEVPTDPALWWGVLAQVIVAAGLLVSARVLITTLTALPHRTGPDFTLAAPRLLPLRPPIGGRLDLILSTHVSQRAPPPLLSI